MTRNYRQYIPVLIMCLVSVFVIAGCSSKEEKTASAKPVIAPGSAVAADPAPSSLPSANAPAPVAPEDTKKSLQASAIAVEVDGNKLTTKQLDAEMQQKLTLLKGQIPPESLEQAKTEIRKTLVDEFVVRTLLAKEINKKKITVSDKEVAEIMDSMKSQLPAGVTMDDILKKNNIDVAKMREEITMNIKINKVILQEMGGKITVTDKEISEFYNNNKDKFKKPESVHARHILVAKAAGDTDKIKSEKKTKVEGLRKSLVGGADFAEIAKKNSDCPSKENGGDLGSFSRGQMVKPFEDAAFSQEKNAIGPVVETDFGFHIIQVLEHQTAQVMKLDAETKKQITAFLEREKQQAAFTGLIKKLKTNANIVVYGK